MTTRVKITKTVRTTPLQIVATGQVTWIATEGSLVLRASANKGGHVVVSPSVLEPPRLASQAQATFTVTYAPAHKLGGPVDEVTVTAQTKRGRPGTATFKAAALPAFVVTKATIKQGALASVLLRLERPTDERVEYHLSSAFSVPYLDYPARVVFPKGAQQMAHSFRARLANKLLDRTDRVICKIDYSVPGISWRPPAAEITVVRG
jgi:hypothetical protein